MVYLQNSYDSADATIAIFDMRLSLIFVEEGVDIVGGSDDEALILGETGTCGD